MTVAVIVALLALVAAIVAGATWRRTADERRSVKDHQRTLETLRQLPERRMQGFHRPKHPVSPAPPSPRTPASAPTGSSQPPAPSDGEAEIESPEDVDRLGSRASPGSSQKIGREAAGAASPKVDTGTRPARVSVDDQGPTVLARYQDPVASTTRARVETDWSGTPRPAPQLARDLDKTTLRAGTERRPLAMAVAALVAVAVVVALALTLSSPTASHSTAHGSSTTTAHRNHHASSSGLITASSSSPFSATYSVPRGPFTVTLVTSGPCWVMATDKAKGTVVWTGTLAAGERRAIPATSGLDVRLGASGVAVTVGSRAVQLPQGYRVPFDMSFMPT